MLTKSVQSMYLCIWSSHVGQPGDNFGHALPALQFPSLLWAYLNTPFLYTWPGFVTDEITPIQVGGEKWRRLKVTFPDHIKSHTREQISCFGPDGLLRRQDYTVDILGGAPGLNYATDYREVDGIVIPTTRRIPQHKLRSRGAHHGRYRI